MSGEFTVAPTFEDYRAANWLMFKRSYVNWRIIRYLAIIAVLYFLLLAAIDWRNAISGFSVIMRILRYAMFGAVIAVFAKIVIDALRIARSTREVFTHLGTIDLRTTYVFSEVGLKASHERGVSDLLWSHMLIWIENGRLLIIFRTPNSFFLVPKAQVTPETLGALRDTLAAAGVKHA